MTSLSSSLFDSMPATRVFFHTAIIGVSIGVAFVLGNAFAPGNNMVKLLLALLFITLYVVVRLLLRLRRLQAQAAKLSDQAAEDLRQAEDLVSLNSLIQPVRPLPPMRGWAMSPDILKHIAATVLDRRPTYVVEASSGVSTLVIAYCLKRLGAGAVISLEHDAKFATANQQQLIEHQLDGFARVVHAPLITHHVQGQQLPWYSLDAIDSKLPIDMLVIDGPPKLAASNRLVRYAAVPLLYDQLADGCKIILDDADRDQERQVVKLWSEQFSDLTHELIEFEKGASILTKGATGLRSAE